jgi:hypothetical protein
MIFGLPLNMVHGQLRFTLLYGLGIFGGAMSFIAVGGGFGQLIGCSGGVYAILGMHLAEVLLRFFTFFFFFFKSCFLIII